MIDLLLRSPNMQPRLAKTRAKWPHAGWTRCLFTDPQIMAVVGGAMTGGRYTVHQGVLLTHEASLSGGGRAMGQWQVPSAPTYLEDDTLCRLTGRHLCPEPRQTPDGGIGPPDRRRGARKRPYRRVRARQLLFHRLCVVDACKHGYRASTSRTATALG